MWCVGAREVAQYSNIIPTDIMASGSGHPTAGRRRKYSSPAARAAKEAIARLQPPVMPVYLRGDAGDGLSGSEEKMMLKDYVPLPPLLDLQEEWTPMSMIV